MNYKFVGGDFDDFLEEEGILHEVEAIAIKRVLVFQLQQEITRQGLSKTIMAKKMNTSRTSIDRLLNPDNDAVTLKTLWKAAAVLGKKLRIEFA